MISNEDIEAHAAEMMAQPWWPLAEAEIEAQKMSKMDELFELLSHIEFQHERELSGPYNFSRLEAIHDHMHETREWDHIHFEDAVLAVEEASTDDHGTPVPVVMEKIIDKFAP